MDWSKAFTWAAPIWLAVCAAMLAINYAAEAKASLFDMSVALLVFYPLCAFIVKATSEDWSKWRAAYGSSDDEIEKR